MQNRPNIVYIHSHDTGRYIQPYGYAIPTPALQKFAEEGVLFRKAFCVGPTCSPSRAALLTGEVPHSCGMFGLAHRHWKLNDFSKHIIHTLHEYNYDSTLIGFQHVVNWNSEEEIGYKRIYEIQGKQAPEIAVAAKDFFEEKHTSPFFVSIGITHTHRFTHTTFSNSPEAQGDSRYCMVPSPLPDTPETRQDMADFIEAAKVYDKAVGDILQAIKDNNLEESTIVLITTDHGIAFPHMKCTLFDSGTGVLFMMRGPKNSLFRGGKVVDEMISHMDFFPTICDLLDIPKPERLQGKSLLPLLTGESKELHDAIFGEINYHAANKMVLRSVRTNRYKYIRHYQSDHPFCCDNGISKSLLLKYDWDNQEIPQEQLYDLIFDPNERNNLADNSKYRQLKEQLSSKMEEWMHNTNDPLILSGDIPPVQP